MIKFKAVCVNLLKGVGFSIGKGPVTKEVTKVIEKEVPVLLNSIKPSETVAFGLPKQPDRDYFLKLITAVDEQVNLVHKLKKTGASEDLIKHAEDKIPLKYEKGMSLPEQYQNPDLKKIIESKREKLKDMQIAEFLENKQLLDERRNILLRDMKLRSIDFSQTGITNPDEILTLINSGEYGLIDECSMFKALSQAGKPIHAEKLLPEIDKLFISTAEDAKKNIIGIGESLSNRIMTIGLIGDEKQKASLIAELKRELIVNGNKAVTEAIFRGIGRIGENQPENTKFAEILLNNTLNSNYKLAYEYLSNFNNTFYVITHGMIQNPKSTTILASAYKSAKTPEQKEILLNKILSIPELQETAIRSTTNFYTRELRKNYTQDILSKLAESNSFEALSPGAKANLKRDLSD